MQSNDDEARVQLWRRIAHIPVTMLTTEDADGTLRSRPMVAHQQDFDGELWLFTRSASPKVGEVEHHHQVNLSYAEPARQTYVSISGWADLVRDPARIRQLWTEGLNTWFPNGPDDPDVALLRVRVEHAAYWDAAASAMVAAYGAPKAPASGETGATGLDIH